jgi:hypothetical protein
LMMGVSSISTMAMMTRVISSPIAWSSSVLVPLPDGWLKSVFLAVCHLPRLKIQPLIRCLKVSPSQ